MNPEMFRKDFHYHVKVGQADIFSEFGSPGRLDINYIFDNVDEAYNRFINIIDRWYPGAINHEDKINAYNIIKEYSEAAKQDFMTDRITPDTYLEDFVAIDIEGVPIELFSCSFCEPYYYN